VDGRQHNNQPNKRGSTRGKASRWEATQQPAKSEGCNKRWMHGKRWQLNERGECLLRGGGAATEGGGPMRGRGAGGQEVTQQPA
jgi:hypothetical protein